MATCSAALRNAASARDSPCEPNPATRIYGKAGGVSSESAFFRRRISIHITLRDERRQAKRNPQQKILALYNQTFPESNHCEVPSPSQNHTQNSVSNSLPATFSETSKQSLIMTCFALYLGVSILVANAEPAAAASTLNDPGVVSNSEIMNLALIPEGPMVEEFWENVSRYVTYFFTVATGGIYSLARPMVELLQKPSTAILLVLVLGGTFYLTYVVLSSMLGLDGYQYDYPY